MSQQTKEQKVRAAYPNAECIKHTTPVRKETTYIIRDKVSKETLGEGCNSVVAWFNACMNMLQTA